MTETLVIRGVRMPGGQAGDMLVENGRLAAIAPHVPGHEHATVIDGRGCIANPGLVDGHAHLDKTLWGTPRHSHEAGPTIIDRIRSERRVLRERGHSPRVQSARLLRHMIARGTTHVRTHVDIGPETGLDHLHGVQDTIEAYRPFVDFEVVAFPQTGVMIEPGTLDLLDQAVREGAGAIGGLDPVGIDNDPAGQLNAIFAIAERRGCAIAIHLHDRGAAGAATEEMIARRVQSLGLKGRVAISHAFCLGTMEPPHLERVVRLLVDNDIAVMTHGPSGGTPFPPIRHLAEGGVRLFTGSDGVRDCWTPLNTGDMLERAYLLAYLSGFRDDAGLRLALHMATYGGAGVIGAQAYGLNVGDRADLVLVRAENEAEAVALHPQARTVIKRGRVVAGDVSLPLPDPD